MHNEKEVQQTLDVSTPQAKYKAPVSLVALDNCCASYGNVICEWKIETI